MNIGVTISRGGQHRGAAGEMFFLNCLVEITPYPLPEDVSAPIIEWFYGPSNTSLPSGVAVLNESTNNNIYNSTLQFSHLKLSHAGMYTCRLRGNERLAVRTMLTVDCNGKTSFKSYYFLVIILNLNSIEFLHDSGNKLQISGDESNVYVRDRYTLRCYFIDPLTTNDSITYRWKKDGSILQDESNSTLSFSSVRLSDAGQYTCEVTKDSILFCATKDISLERMSFKS